MKAKFLLCRSAMAKMLAAAIAIIVVVGIAGGAYYLTLSAPSLSPPPTPTPLSSPSPTPTPTPEPIIVAEAAVFEGEKWMKIFDNGTVRGYSDHIYPNYKEIEIKEGNVSREEIDILLELFSNLADYDEYVVSFSEELIGEDHIFDPQAYMKISCLPLNKTLKLSFRPPSFPEPETITPEAEEILAKIDKIYRETAVVERIREMNPS